MNDRTTPSMHRVDSLRPLASPARPSVRAAVLPGDRSFKVLQPNRMQAQLSLFPPPAQQRAGKALT
jgi:hypothetical protein